MRNIFVPLLTLHGAESICGTAYLLEYHKCLTAHFEGFQSYDVQNLAKLGEDGVERFLEILLLDLLVEIVDVDGVVGPVFHHDSETDVDIYRLVSQLIRARSFNN